MDLSGWDNPDPAEVHQPTSDKEWDEALARYLGSLNDKPLRRCVEIARLRGAVTMVVETRYLDLDYRSEFSSYYSRQFSDICSCAHRIHFFSKPLDSEELWRAAKKAAYIGYVVVRPVATGLVSRAMLPPPPDLVKAVRTLVTETVNLFGQELNICGVPFAQQDAQLGSCAQAAAWMCHFASYLRGETERRVKADFSLHADASLVPNQSLPSQGLTVTQLSDLFRKFDLPAKFYWVGSLPSPELPWQPPAPAASDEDTQPGSWDHRIISISCRYLNSGFPVLIGTNDHAFILCGYRRSDHFRPKWIEFIRHDDQLGPYLVVDNVLDDIDRRNDRVYGPWRTIHAPLPDKIWLSPEAAERQGGVNLLGASELVTRDLRKQDSVESLADLIARERLALRTYVTKSNNFKASVA